MKSKVDNQFFVPHNVLEEEKFLSLPLSAQILYIRLCKLKNRLGDNFYRDLNTLAKETGISRRSVIYAKKALLKAQYIGVERNYYTASGNRSADFFHLNGYKYKENEGAK
jgi:hypothetical protein